MAAAFNDILRRRAVRTVFQPIVHLETGDTVGYEALVRGPSGSPLASADSLLAEAYRAGRVVEFDWVARASACRAALAAGLSRDRLLFLNIEPLALGSDCPPDLRPDIEHAFGVLQVVLEVTERSLGRDPRSLLDGIDFQRRDVTGLALDDVGAETMTLAMLPILSADVIKLDLKVTQGGTSAAALKVLDIVLEEAERTGATLLAEGVETVEHFQHAMAFGAVLGQGNYFGGPRALPPAAEEDSIFSGVVADEAPAVPTPFDALAGRRTSRATPDLLLPLSRQVAFGETDLAEPALAIHLVPDPALFGPDELHVLTRLAGRGVITGVLGRGISAQPATSGVRRADSHDPALDGQWALLALSPSAAGAMLARAVPDTAHFDFAITHDRRRVVAAARCLLRRLGPTPSP